MLGSAGKVAELRGFGAAPRAFEPECLRRWVQRRGIVGERASGILEEIAGKHYETIDL